MLFFKQALSLQPSGFPRVPPISGRGNVNEIVGRFGDAEQLRSAVNQLHHKVKYPVQGHGL